LDLITLASNITNAVIYIDSGRKGFATRGKEHEGRINYELGISAAMSAFQLASNQRFAAAADPQALILAEYTFITQEFQLCDKTDKDTINSLTKAIQSFDDAFLALQAVEDKQQYHGVEKSIPHDKKYRITGYPKDAFHIACISHKTRLQNILRTPGLDPIEKDLLKQRYINLSAGQGGYVEKQKKALINQR
jgi:hypothetical protein